MRTCLIIGNGFDLDLGLHTRFIDFMNSSDFRKIEKDFKHGDNGFFIHLNEVKNDINSWLDFENELVNYSNLILLNDSIKYKNKLINDFENCFDKFNVGFANYLKKLPFNSIIDKIDTCAYQTIKEIASNNTNKIIVFNFTPSVEILLKHFNVPEEQIERRVLYVHGKLSEKNTITGIIDDVLPTDSTEFHFLLKSRATACDIFEEISDCNKITFFGHSLGKQDTMYFKKYFNEYLMPKEMDESLKLKLIFIDFDKKGHSKLNAQINRLTLGRSSLFYNRHKVEKINTSLNSN